MNVFAIILAMGVAAQPQYRASYYGQECQNRLTASGQLFDKNKLAAASLYFKSGQKPYYLYIHKGDKEVKVLVNDRLPFKYYLSHHVTFDLSEAAFKALVDTKEGIITITTTNLP